MKRLTRTDTKYNGYTHQEAISSELDLGECMQRLAEYEDAEEQGLLLRLPCKVGDMVYEANKVRNMISTYEITEIIINKFGVSFFRWNLIDGIYSALTGCPIECFGKSVFLTKEAAEEALKEANK